MVGQEVNDLVCGRILLRQANLTDLQRELLAIKGTALFGFHQMADMLRTLDRSEVISKGSMMGSSAGNNTTKAFFGMEAHEDDGQGEDDGAASEEDDASTTTVSDGFIMMEDREYTEMEAVYLQAYQDVRRDLRQRRRERGYIKHQRQGGRKASRGGRHERSGGRGHPSGGGRSQQHPKKFKGNAQDLASRTKCFSCGELGHFAADCPRRRQQSQRQKPPQGSQSQTFVASTGTPQVTTTVGVMYKDIQIFNALSVRGFEALLDTGAEEGVLGTTAYQALQQELLQFGLTDVRVSVPPTSCAGVGGRVDPLFTTDVPVGIAQLHGVIRFTVLQDSEDVQTPPLLPVSFLETIGASIDLQSNTLSTRWSHQTGLRRLASKHRVVNMLDYGSRPWRLPDVHRGPSGTDPFVIQQEYDQPALQHPPMPIPDGDQSGVQSGSHRTTRARDRADRPAQARNVIGSSHIRSRSRSLPANVLINQEVTPRHPARPLRDVLVWCKLANGQIEHIETVPGPVTELLHPVQAFSRSHVQALTPRRAHFDGMGDCWWWTGSCPTSFHSG